jgi:ketosteroid isomerase-like protein
MTTARDLSARDLSIASLEAVKAGDRQAWLDLYDEDGVIQDPVGKSHYDSTGEGHRGKVAIGKFWDAFSAQQKAFDYEIHKSALCGNEVAVYATLHITLKSDQAFSVDVLNVYKQADSGKIASLRSFWEGGNI